MPDTPKVHTIRVYREERYSDVFKSDTFVVKEGMLLISREGIMLAVYAIGQWASFVDETQLETFSKADRDKSNDQLPTAR